MLTPHFYPLREELQSFLNRRQRAYEKLVACWGAQAIPQIKLGAEVRYSPSLVECDLQKLALGQGKYLLLELSDTVFPMHLEQIIKIIIQEQGIIPILAHVERCEYFLQKFPSKFLRHWVSR